MSNAIEYSRGQRFDDAYPQNRSAMSFEAFRAKVLADKSAHKGLVYITAPFRLNGDGRPHRCKAGALARSWLAFDFDYVESGDLFIEIRLWFSERYLGFGYFTASSTPAAPRARIILAADREMTPEELERVCLAIERDVTAAFGPLFKLDRCVYRAEQPVFTPTVGSQSFQFDGDLVDVDRVLVSAPPSERTSSSTEHERATEAENRDPVVKELDRRRMLIRHVSAGKLAVICPCEGDHSSTTSDTATVYMLPNFAGVKYGKFSCLHEHCSKRPQEAFLQALGLDPRVVWAKQADSGKDRQQAANGSGRGSSQPEQVIPIQDDAGEVTLFTLSEDALAIAFAQKFKGRLLFDHTRGAWLVWNGHRWRLEETRLAYDWVRKFLRKVNTENSQRWTKAAAFNAVEVIARTDRAFAKTSANFDRDPWLLATPEGVIDLRTGALLPADPGLMITKCTAVEPGPVGVLPVQWLAFLDQATQGDQELIRFLQQVLGYALTGVTTEQMLVFVFGPGGNGKGVFINTAQKILADYAQTADMAVFTASRNDRHPTELAALKGARLVAASETERDRPWAESRIKQLTGGDRIRARFMRQDEFEFDPQFQLVIVGNHKPRLRAVDDAMRRRLNIVNFMHRPPVKNPNLEVELREEWPAILRWMVEGCLDWQRNGLIRPAVVIEATTEYLNEQDLLKAWIDECCEQSPQYQELAGDLFTSWTAFSKQSGEEPGTQTAFGSELGRAGFNRRRVTGGRYAWLGLRLVPKPAQADPRSPGEWDQ